MSQNKWVRRGVATAIVLVLLLGAAYAFIMWEGSSARGNAPAIEMAVAQWLLYRTVPGNYIDKNNPLARHVDVADVEAGHEVYRKKCEICHAYNGSGKTEIGAGQYPRPPDLRNLTIQKMSDGELFFHITNGIRHTGMPAWGLPERKAWQLVLYLRNLPRVAAPDPAAAGFKTADLNGATYVGSASCKDCHSDIYERWKKTRMANVVRDPREHPDAIAPDLSKPDPL